jgi:hypothetical protein
MKALYEVDSNDHDVAQAEDFSEIVDIQQAPIDHQEIGISKKNHAPHNLSTCEILEKSPHQLLRLFLTCCRRCALVARSFYFLGKEGENRKGKLQPSALILGFSDSETTSSQRMIHNSQRLLEGQLSDVFSRS